MRATLNSTDHFQAEDRRGDALTDGAHSTTMAPASKWRPMVLWLLCSLYACCALAFGYWMTGAGDDAVRKGERLRQSLLAANVRVTELESTLKFRDTDLLGAQHENEALTEAQRKTGQALTEEQDKNSELRDSLAADAKTIRNLQHDKEDLRQSAEALTTEREKNAELRGSAAADAKTIRSLQQDREDLRQSTETMRKMLGVSQQERDGLREKLLSATSDLGKARQDLTVAQARISELERAKAAAESSPSQPAEGDWKFTANCLTHIQNASTYPEHIAFATNGPDCESWGMSHSRPNLAIARARALQKCAEYGRNCRIVYER